MAERHTRTGNNFFTKVGNFFAWIPIVGGLPAAFFTAVGAVWDSAGWLLRLKPLSAATALGAGGVAAASNFASGSGVWWFANAGSAIFSGRSAGSHARGLTEGAIGVTTGALGLRPTVLRSYPAGIGSINGGMQQQGPGYWATRAAQERGQDPNARYAAYRGGDGRDHLAALEAASARGNSRGM